MYSKIDWGEVVFGHFVAFCVCFDKDQMIWYRYLRGFAEVQPRGLTLSCYGSLV